MTMVQEKASSEGVTGCELEIPTDDVATCPVGTLESVIFLPSPAKTESEVDVSFVFFLF